MDAPHSEASAAAAVALVREGKAEALMKGSLHTDELMGAVVKRDTGLRTARRISHCFVMDVPGHPEPLIITDAAVNIAPTLEDKVHIVQNAIDLAHDLGVTDVRVAILSAMETVNPDVPSTLEAAALCKMADRGQITGGVLDGPLALDNAISLEAAKIKKIDSPVAGRANVLVVPDLEAGNMLAKSLSFLAGRGRRRHRARRARADHPHQPRRLGDDAPGLLRGRRARRARAPRECREGRGDDRRDPRSERRLVEHQVPALRRAGRRRSTPSSAGQIEGIYTAPRFVAHGRGRHGCSARSPGARASSLGHDGAVALSRGFPARQSRAGCQLAAVGHRVVHGGPGLRRAGAARPRRARRLEKLIPLAPLHQPHNLAPIRSLLERRPDLPQVACFDTAFHPTNPDVSRRFAIPSRAARRRRAALRISRPVLRVRRLGAARDTTRAPPRARPSCAISATARACARSRAGNSVASTMGFTAVDGLPMGTRCGAIDPGVLLYLMDERGMDARAIEKLIYSQSGLLGVSGISSDMRKLLDSDDPRAKLAVDLFVYRIRRELGSLAAALGGLDALVFTAGIGENSAGDPRTRLPRRGLARRGARRRRERPGRSAHQHARAAGCRAWVIPTNEELMIARHTQRLIERPR